MAFFGPSHDDRERAVIQRHVEFLGELADFRGFNDFSGGQVQESENASTFVNTESFHNIVHPTHKGAELGT